MVMVNSNSARERESLNSSLLTFQTISKCQLRGYLHIEKVAEFLQYKTCRKTDTDSVGMQTMEARTEINVLSRTIFIGLLSYLSSISSPSTHTSRSTDGRAACTVLASYRSMMGILSAVLVLVLLWVLGLFIMSIRQADASSAGTCPYQTAAVVLTSSSEPVTSAWNICIFPVHHNTTNVVVKSSFINGYCCLPVLSVRDPSLHDPVHSFDSRNDGYVHGSCCHSLRLDWRPAPRLRASPLPCASERTPTRTWSMIGLCATGTSSSSRLRVTLVGRRAPVVLMYGFMGVRIPFLPMSFDYPTSTTFVTTAIRSVPTP